MTKVDKDYVDAQIASVEEKFETRLKEILQLVSNQNPLPKNSNDELSFPAGSTPKDGQPAIITDEKLIEAFGKKVVGSVIKAQSEHEKKLKAEGKKTQSEWYASIYNYNVENWHKTLHCFEDLFNKREGVKKDVQALNATVSGIKADMDSMAKAVEKLEKMSKPTGIFMYGKHIAGCYFFTFMAFVFIFLGLFSYGFFEMKERAKQANVKLEVIRDEYGQVPAVKRTFEVLDSVYADPIPLR